jgi:hypothetical protein
MPTRVALSVDLMRMKARAFSPSIIMSHSARSGRGGGAGCGDGAGWTTRERRVIGKQALVRGRQRCTANGLAIVAPD